MPGLDADLPRPCLVELRVVELERTIEVLVSLAQRAFVVQGRADAPLGDHQHVAVVDASRQFEQLLGQLVRDADLAARDVVRRQAHQDRDDLPRILDLAAQFARAPIGLARLPGTA